MWKAAIVLLVAIFVTTRADIDRHQVIESVDHAKELIIRHYINVHQGVIDSAERAYGDLSRYVNFLANGMDETIKKIGDEVEKLFENSSTRTKRKCKIYHDYLGGAVSAVRENMEDCAKIAVLNAEENFSKAFNCLQDAKKNLAYQRRLARICRNNDYNKILEDTQFIINNAFANITAEYQAYIGTISNGISLDECINDNTTGYKQLSNAAPIVIANTKRCIGKLSIHGQSIQAQSRV